MVLIGIDPYPTGQWKVTSFMNPWRISRLASPETTGRCWCCGALRRQGGSSDCLDHSFPLKKISNMCTPGVDRIWKFHENPKHTHWNGNIFEDSICYLLQDDFICIYVYTYMCLKMRVCRYIHITHSSLQCISVYLCAWIHICIDLIDMYLY